MIISNQPASFKGEWTRNDKWSRYDLKFIVASGGEFPDEHLCERDSLPVEITIVWLWIYWPTPRRAAWQRYCRDTRHWAEGRAVTIPQAAQPSAAARPKQVCSRTNALGSKPSWCPCIACNSENYFVIYLFSTNTFKLNIYKLPWHIENII